METVQYIEFLATATLNEVYYSTQWGVLSYFVVDSASGGYEVRLPVPLSISILVVSTSQHALCPTSRMILKVMEYL